MALKINAEPRRISFEADMQGGFSCEVEATSYVLGPEDGEGSDCYVNRCLLTPFPGHFNSCTEYNSRANSCNAASVFTQISHRCGNTPEGQKALAAAGVVVG